jgi:gluconokinase
MVIVVIGPAGSGKSTVGSALARTLGWRFVDADTLHSNANVARLRRGESLTDAQRSPWLEAVAGEITSAIRQHRSLVVACSALRRAYRETLRPANAPAHAVRFVYLKVSASELARRLATRADHFAPPALLASQLATLEEPAEHEVDAATVDAEQSVDTVVDAIAALTLRGTSN